MSKPMSKPMSKQPKEQKKIFCEKCGIYLTLGKVSLAYLGTAFPVDLYKCPQCGLVYIPEELAKGKMQQAESSLEDK